MSGAMGPVARYSLGLSRNAALLFVFAGLGVAGALVKVAHVDLHGQTGALKAFAIYGCAIALTALLPSRIARRVRLARLARLGLPLDLGAYLAALDTRAVRGSLVVDATFDGAPGGASPVSTTSPVFPTLIAGIAGNYHDNRRLHRWFMQHARTELAPRTPTSVQVRFVAAAPTTS